MSFDLGGGSDGPVSEINVTPMVDIMLVLLIIFMITAPMMSQGVEVELPQTVAAPMEDDSERLILTMTKEGRFYLGKAEIPEPDLERRLTANVKLKASGALLLHADHHLGYGEVVAVMARLRAAGVKSLGMVTDPLGAAP